MFLSSLQSFFKLVREWATFGFHYKYGKKLFSVQYDETYNFASEGYKKIAKTVSSVGLFFNLFDIVKVAVYKQYDWN